MNQDKQLESYFEGLARAASVRDDVRFSRFLDPSEMMTARMVAAHEGIRVDFFGGYSDAERTVAAFYTQSSPEPERWPVVCMKAAWKKHTSPPGHRDFLGAQMGLGLQRGCFGDILLCADYAYLYVKEDVTSYVEANLTSAGRAAIVLTPTDGFPEDIPEPAGKTIRETVSSMRLDAVAAAAWNLSRAQAQTLIAREYLKLNHTVCTHTDARVEEGDLLSVRGYGRARVTREAGMTRKGRMAIEIFLYGDP